ncbi:YjjG family noncanonical pyrimidine nucleotidase [Ligilactobacillus sp. Marseille-Q7487]|uniref:YjjG family noncanonical pyrimidine nucleotidase n=1 Tax=Ligilactobacillus sp. Marseille-Q7487 TaxID=3022128 RepID=UPI0024A946E5|nr:YjjG family noncanonical pyrimidine nucleotidase [Ligilactobacillus sp. Marseille-Q7487]
MTQKYTDLLFDLDDTLLDFGATETQALRLLFATYNLEMTPQLEKDYKKFNQSLWKKLELGTLSRKELLEKRFSTFFKEHLALDVDGIVTGKQYTSFLAQGHQQIKGAKELLQDLKKANYRLHIVTNGNKNIQYKRLDDSHFNRFFDTIFISEEIGYQKPTKQFFEHIFNKLDLVPNQAIIIGDSLSSDIKGGINAGIDTLWYNPAQIANNSTIQPTYEIHKLEEIKEIV